ncbi:MAG: M28 family peptidase [Bacteroidetes bacterium]|nr:M28 family peptidase [Bacteroidota bacterium]
MNKYLVAGCLIFCLNACSNTNSDNTNSEQTTATPTLVRPSFDADSAYAYIAKQVSFGPRVPSTIAQKNTAEWMRQKLRQFCDSVYVQDVKVKAGNGNMLPCINLIGAINPHATRRILLLAHWDSRPWADQDTKDTDKPIDGADDGASGVGVLLELARQIKSKPLPKDLGVDILFADVEDYGKTEWGDNSYALGTQYWAHHPHVPNYKAEFGILLDMVGGRNARFPMEGQSARYASEAQQKVWQAANAAGYSSFFPYTRGSDITDDHVFVNEILHIPTIDIINLPSNSRTSFGDHWHTHSDNMEIIDKQTLKAVGETLLQVIYQSANPAA